MSWFCFVVLSTVALLSAATDCSCALSSLSKSFSTSPEVFTATVLGASNDGTALVAVTEVFKGSSFSINDLVYIRYSCGSFPVRSGTEGVFFSTDPTNVGGSFVTHLVDCTRNGPITETERGQLRTGLFLPSQCSVPETGAIYNDGESFTDGCRSCVCTGGEISCTECAPQPYQPPSGCSSPTGTFVAEGDSIQVDCNFCSCTSGRLLCTEMDCVSTACIVDGVDHNSGDIWEVNECQQWTCEDGNTRMLRDYCGSGNNRSSKFFIIGISLASAIVIVVMATVVAVIRNRIKAREASRNGGILLDEVHHDSDSDDAGTFVPANNNFQSTGVNSYSQPFGNNLGTFAYPSPAPMWGGQQVATTPMVLMTQTGEPVVVQVAYM